MAWIMERTGARGTTYMGIYGDPDGHKRSAGSFSALDYNQHRPNHGDYMAGRTPIQVKKQLRRRIRQSPRANSRLLQLAWTPWRR
jgi:hypothetical protein